MKTKTTLLSIIVLMIGIGLLNSSCKNDKEKDMDNSGTNHFSYSFQDGYKYDYAWVVLHNLEGTEVVDYKKIEGDGIADFGEINGGKVTVTTIRVDTFSNANGDDSRSIHITSDYNSPSGNWVFKGVNYYDGLLGAADITMTYPASNYNEYHWATSYNSYYSDEVPSDQIHVQDNMYRLDGGKCSVYGAVVQDDGGRCNWLLDQSFQLGQTNYYNLELINPLDRVNFVSSKALTYFYIKGCWNQRVSNLNLYYKEYMNKAICRGTNHNAYLPANMPFPNLVFTGIYTDGYILYSYRKYFNATQGLPDIIEIPDITTTAIYNESTDEITNIQIDGTVDQLFGNWNYHGYTDTNHISINWDVYANWDSPSIKRPVLPQEIIDDIGCEVNIMQASCIGLIDYNSTASHSDIIRRFFIYDTPVYQRYDESYSYSHNFDSDKSRDLDKIDAERNKAQRHNFRH
jgi:hypothetical protein